MPGGNITKYRIQQGDAHCRHFVRRLRTHIQPQIVLGDDGSFTTMLAGEVTIGYGRHAEQGSASSQDSQLLTLVRLVPKWVTRPRSDAMQSQIAGVCNLTNGIGIGIQSTGNDPARLTAADFLYQIPITIAPPTGVALLNGNRSQVFVAGGCIQRKPAGQDAGLCFLCVDTETQK